MNEPIQKRLEIRTLSHLSPERQMARPAEIAAVTPRILDAIRDGQFGLAGRSFDKNASVRNSAAHGQSLAIIRVPLPRITPPRWPDDPNSRVKRQRVAIYFDPASESVAFEKPIHFSSDYRPRGENLV